MKVRILKRKKEDTERIEEIEIDYELLLKDLLDDVILLKDSLTEESDGLKALCNRHDYYKLKNILVRLNALSMASKGKLTQKIK